MRAFRVFYIAETYAALSKWSEALMLFDRAAELEEEAQEVYSGLGIDVPASFESLAEKIVGARNRAHARGYLAQMATGGSGGGSGPNPTASALGSPGKLKKASKAALLSKTLQERLHEFDAGDPGDHHKLIDFPPALRPIACKPLLFDIALNNIEFPDLDEKAGKKGKSGEGGGWLGWLSGKK